MPEPDALYPVSKNIVSPLHRVLVSNRRSQRLVKALVNLMPPMQSLSGLDVGCGNGAISKRIEVACCGRTIMDGVDVIVRDDAIIKVTKYDGMRLPFTDKSFDFCMLVDVLHHSDQPDELLREVVRVARTFIFDQRSLL